MCCPDCCCCAACWYGTASAFTTSFPPSPPTPNPFSTSTKFVFTLTGSEVPDEFQIQIFTVTGKVIREIDEAELGPVFIGKNISSFAWDGRDRFGDLVANGVYLYRVKAQIGGKEIKQLESGADDYFKNGFGKMYLIR